MYGLRTVLALTLVAAAAGLLVPPAPAQQSQTSAVENSEIFTELELPTPNSYRNGGGTPGEDYWQQDVDYDIEVRLHPDSNVVRGSETISYTNNSPSELEYLWLQLDQNLFDPSSEGAAIVQPGQRFSGIFPGGGYDISDVRITVAGRTVEPEYMIDGTVMRVTLPRPLPAGGGEAELSLDFRFEIPSYGADRMGRLDVERGTVYELAQWYPRVFTFDDVHGWNVMPYLGQGEFYLEYGSFDVAVTVPREFVVVGTGRLQNEDRVLTETQRQRLEKARTSSETVHLIREDEVGDPATRPEGRGPLTWRFRADSVRDFAWAASQAFIWDAASWDDVLLMSVYPHEGLGSQKNPGWERSTRFLRHSVSYYSEQWEDYPYPVAVNVAGVVAGMEYPMVLFCDVESRGQGLFGVTDHELAHTYFPMLVGSDERRWYWMDEGLVQFMGMYSTRAFYGASMSLAQGRVMDQVAKGLRQNETGLPILTYTDRVPSSSFGWLGYAKPAFGLVLLREVVLGPERFDPALREYIDRWKYRHPKPADFFRTIEDVAGEDLDWFWQGWFDGTKSLDQAVTDVAVTGDTTRVTLEQEGLVMPARVRLEYGDGSTETRRIPVEGWHTSDVLTTTITGREVQAVRVDPDRQLPDVDRSNNSWTASGGADGG